LNQFDHQVWMQKPLDNILSIGQKQSYSIDLTK